MTAEQLEIYAETEAWLRLIAAAARDAAAALNLVADAQDRVNANL